MDGGAKRDEDYFCAQTSVVRKRAGWESDCAQTPISRAKMEGEGRGVLRATGEHLAY